MVCFQYCFLMVGVNMEENSELSAVWFIFGVILIWPNYIKNAKMLYNSVIAIWFLG